MFAFSRIAFAAKAASGGAVGQVVILPGTTSWTVPAGVTSISMVCVQAGQVSDDLVPAATSVTVGGVVVCRAATISPIGDGGGYGGIGGEADGESISGGGGGAAGYSGYGGDGGGYLSGASSGAGGGGGGGAASAPGGPGGRGGGVGLLGAGTNGAAGSPDGANGGNGSPQTDVYGAGWGGNGAGSGGRGGALRYKNNVAVTPGQTITIAMDNTATPIRRGAVRIIWGAGRAYPSTNTQDM